MKLLNKITTTVLILGGICSIVSCGNKKRTVDQTLDVSEASQDMKAEVTFWTNLYTTSDITYMDGVVEEFNKIYPNITVNWEKSGKYTAIKSAIDSNIVTTDKLPNIAVVYPDYIVNYISTNKILDMTPYIESDVIGFGKTYKDGEVVNDETTALDDFSSVLLKENQNYTESGTYTMPYAKTSEALFINKNVFDKKGYKIPTTFRDLIDNARQMLKDYPDLYKDSVDSEGNTVSTKGLVAPLGFESSANLWIVLCKMLNIDYASSEDKNGDGELTKSEAVLFNNDKAKKLMKMLKSLYDERIFTTSSLMTAVAATGQDQYIETPFGGTDDDDSTIESNPMFMCVDSTKGSWYIAQNSKFVSQALPYPSIDESIFNSSDYSTGGDKGDLSVISQGGSVVFFNKDNKSNIAAWLFYKFLTNTENAATMSSINTCVPLRESSYETTTIKEIVAEKDADLEPTVSQEKENEYLIANILDLYESYSENSNYYMAPVNAFSSSLRTTIDSLMTQVLTSNKTGDELDEFIDTAFEIAYLNI